MTIKNIMNIIEQKLSGAEYCMHLIVRCSPITKIMT